jgi:hypothetical protein
MRETHFNSSTPVELNVSFLDPTMEPINFPRYLSSKVLNKICNMILALAYGVQSVVNFRVDLVFFFFFFLLTILEKSPVGFVTLYLTVCI